MLCRLSATESYVLFKFGSDNPSRALGDSDPRLIRPGRLGPLARPACPRPIISTRANLNVYL
jgi:hypothetical protein